MATKCNVGKWTGFWHIEIGILHNLHVSRYTLLFILFQPSKNTETIFMKQVAKSVVCHLFKNIVPMLISQFWWLNLVCNILTSGKAGWRVCGNSVLFLQLKNYLKVKSRKKKIHLPGSLQLGHFFIFIQRLTPWKTCSCALFLLLHLSFALPKLPRKLSPVAPKLANVWELSQISSHVTSQGM